MRSPSSFRENRATFPVPIIQRPSASTGKSSTGVSVSQGALVMLEDVFGCPKWTLLLLASRGIAWYPARQLLTKNYLAEMSVMLTGRHSGLTRSLQVVKKGTALKKIKFSSNHIKEVKREN